MRVQGYFQIYFTPDIDYYTDEPVVPCDAPVVKNTFMDYCT